MPVGLGSECFDRNQQYIRWRSKHTLDSEFYCVIRGLRHCRASRGFEADHSGSRRSTQLLLDPPCAARLPTTSAGAYRLLSHFRLAMDADDADRTAELERLRHELAASRAECAALRLEARRIREALREQTQRLRETRATLRQTLAKARKDGRGG